MRIAARASSTVVGIVSALVLACSSDVLWGQRTVTAVECVGTVMDWHGRPVAGAEVVGAEQLYEFAAGRIDWGPPSRTTSDEKGRFRLHVSAERRNYVWVVAWRKGLALGWQRMGEDCTDVTVRLDKPTVLAGTVVGEDDQGIAGATVRLCLKTDWMGGTPGVRFDEPREWYTVRTDDRGRFRFDHIPVEASADFWAEAPGRASCWTYWNGDSLSSVAGSQFRAGQTDVRIVLKPEALLRGRVVDGNSGKGVPGVRLLARPDTGYANYSCVAPVTSGPDGAFVYRRLAAHDYSLQVVPPRDRAADWTAQDMKITTQAGKTVDVNVPVGKGGVIEVTVEDDATRKPIENAVASVSQTANFGRCPCWDLLASTNTEGLARLRVPPGECRLSVWAPGYSGFSNLERIAVAPGEVVRREVRLAAYPAVTGTVRDADGLPAAGVVMSSKPVGEAPVRTDPQGQFRIRWPPSKNLGTTLILARDPARNLAVLAEVTDRSQPLDVTLAPARVIQGRVTDPNGRPIPAATVALRAFMPGWLTDVAPAVLTDANGVYQIRAIPPSRDDFPYRIEIGAWRYGPARLADLPLGAGSNRCVQAKPVVLMPADRSITGVVVDANDVPAPYRPIFVMGSRGMDMAGQPRRETVSDARGRFVVDGVCAGPLQIQASFDNAPGGAGLLEAQGGDRDVQIVLGREDVHTGLKPLRGRPLPDWKGLLDLDPEQTKGKPILLCFFDLGQRPSRRCLDILAKQADALRQKGVIVAAVQIGAIDDDAGKAWTKEHADKFPVGQVGKDAEKVKSAWGVQSLPWLILTDKKHIVVAEGFGLSDLDKQVEAAAGR